jgi:hypothetical protein
MGYITKHTSIYVSLGLYQTLIIWNVQHVWSSTEESEVG